MIDYMSVKGLTYSYTESRESSMRQHIGEFTHTFPLIFHGREAFAYSDANFLFRQVLRLNMGIYKIDVNRSGVNSIYSLVWESLYGTNEIDTHVLCLVC